MAEAGSAPRAGRERAAVWRIAAPMMLSNVSVPLLGMVDTAVMGHLDEPWYLGAVAVGAALFSFLYNGVNFLRMGTTGIAAQRYGADDADGVRTSLGQALTIALLIAALLLALQEPIGDLAMLLLGPTGEVLPPAREYYFIRIWSAPATLCNLAIVGWFLGMQNARVPLVVVLVVNLTNIVLDFALVVGLGMKADGAALASVIAETAGLAVALGFVARELGRWPGRFRRSRLVDPRAYRAFFAVNTNIFIRTMALMFALGFLTARSTRFGAVILGANAILLNMQYLLSYALDGLAHAAEALIGKAVGARDVAALERAVKVIMAWSVAIAAGFTVVYAFAGPLLVRVLTDLPEVAAAAIDYLPWMVLSPLVSVWSFVYDGVFIGATRAREMRNVMIGSALGVFVPAWYVTQGLGNHGLWLSFMLFMAARGIGMYYYYRGIPAAVARA